MDRFVLVLAGNGSGYLYDAGIDDFVSGRTVIPAPDSGLLRPGGGGHLTASITWRTIRC